MMDSRMIFSAVWLALLAVSASPVWADREDRDDRKVQPQRQHTQKNVVQDQRPRQALPTGQPARAAHPQPEKVRLPEKQRPPETSREQRVVPQPATIKNWGTDDGRDDRKLQPRRQYAQNDAVQEQRPRQALPAGQPVRPPAREALPQPEKIRPPGLARDPRTQPEKIRPPQTERVYRALPEKQRPPETGREPRVVPQPAPIKNWRAEPAPPKVPPKPGYVLDTRYRHNHYYPPRGHIETTLPPARRVVVHNHVHYHYHNGIWYRPHNSHFIVVFPPIGIFVPILPPFYSVVRLSSNTYYYYAGGVYYNWWPAHNTYVVVEAPPEDKVEVVSSGNGSDQLFIYPKLGQNEEQQARDRYDCHTWARSETGFDPTLPNGGVPQQQHASKRADYFRAMKACLEARHYSVQ